MIPPPDRRRHSNVTRLSPAKLISIVQRLRDTAEAIRFATRSVSGYLIIERDAVADLYSIAARIESHLRLMTATDAYWAEIISAPSTVANSGDPAGGRVIVEVDIPATVSYVPTRRIPAASCARQLALAAEDLGDLASHLEDPDVTTLQTISRLPFEIRQIKGIVYQAHLEILSRAEYLDSSATSSD